MNKIIYQSAGLAVCFLAVLIAVTWDSFWIDEVYTMRLASVESFKTFLDKLISSSDAEPQKPLYLIVSWLWVRVVGVAEYRVRLLNIMFVWLSILCCFRIARSTGLAWLPWIFSFHPFTWYYVDEARPYAMLIAGGCLLALSLVLSLKSKERPFTAWSAYFFVGVILAGGSHMLGLITAGLVGLCLIWIHRNSPIARNRTALFLFACAGFIGGILAVYYTWTVIEGAAGARFWVPGWKNIAMSLYEQLGFLGLGPGREHLRAVMREGDLLVLRPYGPGWLALLFLYFILLLCWIKNLRSKEDRRIDLYVLIVYAGSCLILLSLAVAVRWPFWGRHLAAAYPFVLVWTASLLHSPMTRNSVSWRKRIHQIFAAALFLILATSSAMWRFSTEHRKTDYKKAATIASNAINNQRTILWAAFPPAAEFYGLDYDSENGVYIEDGTKIEREQLMFLKPGIVVMSPRRNLHDPHGVIQEYLFENNYVKIPLHGGLTVWRSPGYECLY
jgi:hypothetical protein